MLTVVIEHQVLIRGRMEFDNLSFIPWLAQIARPPDRHAPAHLRAHGGTRTPTTRAKDPSVSETRETARETT